MPLQEHAATVKTLAQIAYSDLPAVHQESYTYDTFVQSLNDLGLHHQFQARGITMVENALHKGKAYLLAKQLHRGHMILQLVTANTPKDYSDQLPSTHVAATTANSLLDTEVTHLTEMVEKLVAILARSSTLGPVQRPMRSQTRPRGHRPCVGSAVTENISVQSVYKTNRS